ncbi:hypothetical protein [Thermopetrobacter sp. TC1]|uniref:hypothetical protein n=1 Tax=Thermopetrobacter sp. TC1 TaxID=1495045 RepID=UPI00056ECAEC|nr:hypothetical protein [Thermopetrobacter sp. TC1]
MKRKEGSLDIHEDYEAIEQAVMETPRGRWFLAEFLRRHQAEETRRLLSALKRLERAMELNQQLAPRIMAAFAAASATMHARPGSLPPALPEAVRAMAAEQRALAARLSTLVQEGDDVSENGAALKEIAAQLDDLARKTEILARGLDDVAVLCGAPHPVAMAEPPMPEDALQWFAAHESLFAEDGEDEGKADSDSDGKQPSAPAAVADTSTSEPDAADEKEPLTLMAKAMIASENAASSMAPDAETDMVEPPHPALEATIQPAPAHEAQTEEKGAETRTASEKGEGRLTIFITPASAEEAVTEDSRNKRSKRTTPRIVISRKSSSKELDIPHMNAVSAEDETA